MSDYRLEFGNFTGPNDTDRLYQLLSIVSEDDDLEITMDNDKNQVEQIVDVLKSNEFEVKTTKVNEDDKCHIYARRK